MGELAATVWPASVMRRRSEEDVRRFSLFETMILKVKKLYTIIKT